MKPKSFIQNIDLFNCKFILRDKRFLWLDYDKGISIILVAYGHCFFMLLDHGINMSAYPYFNYIGTFLYGFRMPLFFIVSGILISNSLRKRGLQAYLLNRVNNILFPLMMWGGIQISLALISARYTNADITPASYLNLIINPRQTGHFWYLNALFFIGVIYSLLKTKLKLTSAIQLLIGLVFFSIAGYINIHDLQAGLLTDICQFYLFFAMGDTISNIFLNERFVKRYTSWKVFLPLLALFIIIQYKFTELNLHGGKDGINFVEHKLPWFYLFEALIGCSLSVSLSFLLQKYKVLSFLRVIGYHSLYIYCMQIIVMNIMRIIFISILKIANVPLLFALIWTSGIVIPMLFYNIALKLNAWWLFTLHKPQDHYDFAKATRTNLAMAER
ncbi:acyltransferase [Mucilaginibacter sabulilitoris]|uniref:Acyltransferase n=1 Tax=Mucilaginibacter sabulilitoris TaxID=1173583 RepID=A0ABZ0TUD5_9SPHI|nr:acyltransferase [Mucilaginibacter sabulilitoris]WPU95688.1 acyltransferase [Mucilaginibacter sabulilitoris]